MPVHDWSCVDAGIFHDFHQAWTIEIRDKLNGGGLPHDYLAMTEQIVSGPIPDAPPQARFVRSAELDVYACKANRIAVKHQLGRILAVIEIVSPGNKSSRHALRAFVEKAYELLWKGIHLLVVDLFPPSRRDPQGLHKAIWDEIREEPFELPADKPLTVAAYSAGEPIAVGDPLPALPIFLEPERYVPSPLEATYQSTWAKLPAAVKQVVEHPDR